MRNLEGSMIAVGPATFDSNKNENDNKWLTSKRIHSNDDSPPKYRTHEWSLVPRSTPKKNNFLVYIFMNFWIVLKKKMNEINKASKQERRMKMCVRDYRPIPADVAERRIRRWNCWMPGPVSRWVRAVDRSQRSSEALRPSEVNRTRAGCRCWSAGSEFRLRWPPFRGPFERKVAPRCGRVGRGDRPARTDCAGTRSTGSERPTGASAPLIRRSTTMSGPAARKWWASWRFC